MLSPVAAAGSPSSGFASQKATPTATRSYTAPSPAKAANTAPAKSAASPTTSKSVAGGFGGNTAAVSPATRQSAFAADMTKQRSQERAMATFESRQQRPSAAAGSPAYGAPPTRDNPSRQTQPRDLNAGSLAATVASVYLAEKLAAQQRQEENSRYASRPAPEGQANKVESRASAPSNSFASGFSANKPAGASVASQSAFAADMTRQRSQERALATYDSRQQSARHDADWTTDSARSAYARPADPSLTYRDTADARHATEPSSIPGDVDAGRLTTTAAVVYATTAVVYAAQRAEEEPYRQESGGNVTRTNTRGTSESLSAVRASSLPASFQPTAAPPLVVNDKVARSTPKGNSGGFIVMWMVLALLIAGIVIAVMVKRSRKQSAPREIYQI